MSKPDFLIVGAGLAGVSAALALSDRYEVVLVDAHEVASRATGIAAGLVNPLMAQRARPVWRMEEALAAFHRQLDQTDARPLFDDRGVLRPARNEQQADFFQETHHHFPSSTAWLTAKEVPERFPYLKAPYGVLDVQEGGAIDAGEWVRAMAQVAQAKGVVIKTNTRIHRVFQQGSSVRIAGTEVSDPFEEEAARVILCTGYNEKGMAALRDLILHAVKGQILELEWPSSIPEDLMPVAGAGYLVPTATTIVVGSTYEHHFDTLEPTTAATDILMQKAADLAPALRTAKVLRARTGVRITVPRLRLPMIGPLPDGDRIWVFSGLGSKGLLMAPLLSQSLPDWVRHPENIPPEIQVRLKTL